MIRVYIRNSNGPKTEPCGTPHLTFFLDLSNQIRSLCIAAHQLHNLSENLGKHLGNTTASIFESKCRDQQCRTHF